MAIRKEEKDTKLIGYRARKERQKAARPKRGNYISKFGSARQENLDRLNKSPKYAEQKPTPVKPSQTTPSQQSRTGSTNNTVSRAVTGKPIPKPAGKVPASNAGMKNQNKDFRGNPNRKDSIASTLSELRSMGSGRKVEGVGPVASGSDYAKSKNETLKERMERMKKRRQGTSIGGVDWTNQP